MAQAHAALQAMLQKLTSEEEATRPAPAASPPVEHRELCLAMATYDDFDGVWFTLQSVLIHHSEVADRISFLVLDNHPTGDAAPLLKALEGQIPNYRYLPFDGFRGTSVRDLLFREADADIVCCVDAHVLLVPGALAAVLAHFVAAPGSRDLLQGPLLSADGTRVSATHMTPQWDQLMYGRWALDAAALERGRPFEIEMHGLGLFACRRDAWPGFNPRLRGFGGEEGYLHEKVRRAGGRVLCHPGVGWAHRFQRIQGVPYPDDVTGRLRNYRFGWDELGWDPSAVEQHFRRHHGDDDSVNVAIGRVDRQVGSAFSACDAVLVPVRRGDRWAEIVTMLDELDVGWRAERVPIETSSGDEWRMAGRRRAVEIAARRGYDHAVVVDPDASLTVAAEWHMATAWSLVADGRADVVEMVSAPSTGAAHLVHRRAFASWPDAGPRPATTAGRSRVRAQTTSGELDTPTLTPVELPPVPGAATRRAVVAVLLARDHLPFIRHWCEHHIAEGWEVHLFDNTGSVGSTRRTSAWHRPLRAERPRHQAFTSALDDREVAAALVAEVRGLPVDVVRWQPRDEDGAIVHGQVEAYVRFIEAYRASVEWAAFIDADEYLVAAPGCGWDDLLQRAAAANCPRVVLDGVRYESRWSPEGRPRDLHSLQARSVQDGASKNIVRLAAVTRADVHWSWQLGRHRIFARPDRMMYGFRHYRVEPEEVSLNLSDRHLATWVDESVAVRLADPVQGNNAPPSR